MQHCTPEQLALAALREPLPEDDEAHLGTCAVCQADVASLQRSVDALAVPELAAPDGAVAPPPSVWSSIAAATGVTAAPRSELVGAGAAAPPPHLGSVDGDPRPAAAGTAQHDDIAPGAGDAVVREFRPRRSRVLLAAAASLVIGAGLGAGGMALLDGSQGAAVAAADLEPLDARGAAGSAQVVARGDGAVLEVELAAPDAEDGYYEVWLLEPGVERMVQVGVVRAGTTTLELPEGIDLAEYPIVDVSVEPLDGDPTHSGVSVARGVLDA